MNLARTQHWPDWRKRPLCVHYLAVAVREQPTLERSPGHAMCVTGRWALGVLHDGQLEVLGWWPEHSRFAADWSAVTAVLADRGVERIRLLVTDAPGALSAAFPGNPVLLPRASCTPETLSSMGIAARHHRTVQRTLQLADAINATIVRRLKRQAPFSCAADALEVVEQSLAQAQRRIDADAEAPHGTRRRHAPWPGALPEPSHRQVVPAAAKGVRW